MTWAPARFPPCLQLLHCRGAKGVGSAYQHLPAFPNPSAGQLAGGGGFSNSVDPNHQQDLKAGSRGTGGRGGRGLQNIEKLRSDAAFDLAGILEPVPVHPGPDPVQKLGAGADPHIGAQQNFLDLLQQVRANLLSALQHLFHAGHQVLPGGGDCRLEPAQKAVLELPALAGATGNVHTCLNRSCRSGSVANLNTGEMGGGRAVVAPGGRGGRGAASARISHQVAEHNVEKCLSLTSCGALIGVVWVQTALGAPW